MAIGPDPSEDKRPRGGWAWALLATALLAGVASQWPDTFLWRRSLVATEPWRWLTGHLTHLSIAHLAVNLAALGLLTGAAWRQGQVRALPGAALASALAIDLGLLWGPWPVAWYGGLSGVLHGLFAWLTLSLAWRLRGRPAGWLALGLAAAGLAKVLADLVQPVGSVGWLGIPVAPPAHGLGYGAGAAWAALAQVRRLKPG